MSLKELSPGLTLEFPLAHATGRIVLGAGITLTEKLIDTLRAMSSRDLYAVRAEQDVRQLRASAPRQFLKPHDLRPGMVLPADLYDGNLRFVAPAGCEITREMAENLSPSEGREFFTFSTEDEAEFKAIIGAIDIEAASELTELVRLGLVLSEVRPTGVAFQKQRRHPRPGGRSAADKKAMLENCKKTIGQMASVFEQMEDGILLAPRPFAALVENIVALLAEDLELALVAAMGEHRFEQLLYHSLSTAMLAAAAGTALDYGRAQVADLVHAGLLSDRGMLRLPRDLLDKKGRLSLEELALIRIHPLFSLGFALRAGIADPKVLLALYQHHERGTGHGYPEAWTAEHIHDYASLLAAADAFDALSRPRAHREALPPHRALDKVIQMSRLNMISPRAVAGLVRAVGNPPLGSRVRLSDGRLGRVVVVNGTFPTRPKIAVCAGPYEPLENAVLIDTLSSQVAFTPEDLPVNASSIDEGF